MTINLRTEVEAIQDEITATRRHLHQHPELGFEEFETAKFVASRLEELGVAVQTNVGKTGVVGILQGADAGPTIGLRADMDALPIQETNDLPFKSENECVMHACGHDGHMAMLLGAARILSEKRGDLKGTVKFIFQPAEEGGGGSRYMIEDGVLKNPDVDEIYGIHLWNYQEFGTIGVKDGPTLAAADKFTITIRGKGGHGAAPQGTVDAIVVAAQLVTNFQTIVSRNTNPLESTVVSIGKIDGGDSFNIIADKVTLYGTARAYSEENRQLIIRRMNEIADGIAKTYGAEIALDYKDGYPLTVNTQAEVGKLTKAAREIVGDNVGFPYLSMGGEDFSYFLQKVPGCFFFVGSAPEDKEPMSVPHHCSHFDINEKALLVGTSVLVQLVEDLLLK